MEKTGAFKQSVFITLAFLALLWGIKALELGLDADFSFLGIYPRTLSGALGIITGHWIHGDLAHLISNTFPLAFLGVGVVYFYRPIAPKVFAAIYMATGIAVWAIARPAFHVGASGVVYGLASFLFFMGLFRRDAPSLAISLVVVFLYHGLFAGLFPLSERVSWESHILGGMTGIVCSFFYRNHEPGPHRGAFNDEPGTPPGGQSAGFSDFDDVTAAEINIKLPEGLTAKITHKQPATKSSGDADIISLN